MKQIKPNDRTCAQHTIRHGNTLAVHYYHVHIMYHMVTTYYECKNVCMKTQPSMQMTNME